jgi:nucleotide-binding universal stress UspA family protein
MVLHVEDVRLYAADLVATGVSGLPYTADKDLHDFVDAAGGHGGRVTVHVTMGDAVSGILTHAARHGSDLIVMGTNGRSGVARAVLGSVAERVVRESSIPVLTVPPSADAPADDLVPFDAVLCASDFSPACREALDLAIAVAQEADSRLILLHALDIPDAYSRIDPAEFRNDALARLKRGLPSDAVFRCRPEPLVAMGRPADAILETARDEGVKLIVMGVQSGGAIDRLLFGSTTRRVITSATCPVLSIRSGPESKPWPHGVHDAGAAAHVTPPEPGYVRSLSPDTARDPRRARGIPDRCEPTGSGRRSLRRSRQSRVDLPATLRSADG